MLARKSELDENGEIFIPKNDFKFFTNFIDAENKISKKLFKKFQILMDYQNVNDTESFVLQFVKNVKTMRTLQQQINLGKVFCNKKYLKTYRKISRSQNQKFISPGKFKSAI